MTHPNAPAVRPAAALVHPDPVADFDSHARDVLALMERYRKFQLALDRRRSDLLIKTRERDKDGNIRTFRPKRYWMVVARAMNVKVELVSEERFRMEATDAETGVVWPARTVQTVYRATLGDQTAIGDGACSEDELAASRRGFHNVRARAHTRAYCRAVSNLVAFGDPVDDSDDDEPPVDDEPRHKHR